MLSSSTPGAALAMAVAMLDMCSRQEIDEIVKPGPRRPHTNTPSSRPSIPWSFLPFALPVVTRGELARSRGAIPAIQMSDGNTVTYLSVVGSHLNN